jgi:hypothetical protein
MDEETPKTGRERSLANLKPAWKKGQSGGGARYPKPRLNLTEEIRKALEANENAQALKLAQAIILQAAKGNGTAMRIVMDRIDGPIKEQIENSGTIRVIFGDDDPSSEPTPWAEEDRDGIQGD